MGGSGSGGVSQASTSLADLMPKVDISGQIKPSLIKELGDKNWKIRGEGLQTVRGERESFTKENVLLLNCLVR